MLSSPGEVASRRISSGLLDPNRCKVYGVNQKPQEHHPVQGQLAVFDEFHRSLRVIPRLLRSSS